MRWAGIVTRMEEGEVYTGILGENLRKKDHLEDANVDGRKILRQIFSKLDVGEWT
jgi:hypothetical protein